MIQFDSDVIITFISTIGTVIVAYIANVKYRQSRPGNKSKDKIDSAFERLEKVATRLQSENDALRTENLQVWKDNTNLRIENARLKK